MKCASGHENPEGQSFCGTCGVPLRVGPAPDSPPLSSGDERGDQPRAGATDAPAGPGSIPPWSAPPEATPYDTAPTPGPTFLPGPPAGAGPAGPPTNPAWGADLPPAPPPARSRKPAALALGAVVAVIVVIGGFIAFSMGRPSTEDKYLDALTEAKQRTEFPTDAAAVLHAKTECEKFERSGDPRGGKAEKIGVSYYCPKWEKDFKLLETRTITGTFSLFDTDLYGDDGDSCEGEGGYGDLNASTQVVLTDGEGKQLARTDLGPGTLDTYTCEFEFEFEATEGEDSYLVEVGDRGAISHTWSELKDGPALSIGS